MAKERKIQQESEKLFKNIEIQWNIKTKMTMSDVSSCKIVGKQRLRRFKKFELSVLPVLDLMMCLFPIRPAAYLMDS